MRKLVAFLLFLSLVSEDESTLTVYAHRMFAPFGWCDWLLYTPLPIKLRVCDLVFIIVIFAAGAKGARTKPMRAAIILGMCSTLFFFVWGVVIKGGDARAASWQIYLMLSGPAAAFATAATHTKFEHYRDLAKVVFWAAIYRAIMCLVFYFGYVRGTDDVPPLMTQHTDTVLWVTGLSIIIVNFLQHRDKAAKTAAYLGAPLILAAIQFNNRRLAWVSLLGALVALFFLLRPSPAKKRLNKIAKMMIPVLGAYVAVGWGRPEKIFKPLASLSSVSSKPDASTLARNVENLSLIATNSLSPPTGTGFGHKYVELSNKYTIEGAMELWPYVPHNSILGMFAYTGFLGVMGYWMMFAVAIFFHARMARLAPDPRYRSAGLIGVMMSISVMNQMFGDMGIFQQLNLFMMAISWAAAMRLPLEAGVWPTVRAPLPATPAAPVGASARG